MKTRAILFALSAATLSFGSAAQGMAADEHHPIQRPGWEYRDHERDAARQAQANRQEAREIHREQRRQERTHRAETRWEREQQAREARARWDRDQQARWERDRRARWDGHRFAYGHPQYRRGGYVPYEYRDRRYYVDDWHSRYLAPPPYGHAWVETDTGDYILMALATGLIVNLLLNQ